VDYDHDGNDGKGRTKVRLRPTAGFTPGDTRMQPCNRATAATPWGPHALRIWRNSARVARQGPKTTPRDPRIPVKLN